MAKFNLCLTCWHYNIEECRDHYHKLAQHHKENRDSFRLPFYLGKRDVCIDILKMFEPLEG